MDTSYKRGRTKVSIGRARCTSLNPDRFPHIFRETGWGSLCSLLSHRRSRSQRRPPPSVATPESSATICRHSIVFLLPVHSTGWFFTFVLSSLLFSSLERGCGVTNAPPSVATRSHSHSYWPWRGRRSHFVIPPLPSSSCPCFPDYIFSTVLVF